MNFFLILMVTFFVEYVVFFSKSTDPKISVQSATKVLYIGFKKHKPSSTFNPEIRRNFSGIGIIQSEAQVQRVA